MTRLTADELIAQERHIEEAARAQSARVAEGVIVQGTAVRVVRVPDAKPKQPDNLIRGPVSDEELAAIDSEPEGDDE